MDEEEEGEGEEEEEEEEVVQEVSKPVRDIRKRADATRILTTEDFQLIGAFLPSFCSLVFVSPFPPNLLSFIPC